MPARSHKTLWLVALPVSMIVALLPGRLGAQRPAYLDPDLPTARRVDDLVGRMTLDEKVSQMMDRAPAIPRLQVPEYNWWNEALHGVARSGVATVFPQAIGLAATWDDALVGRTAVAISDEARAKHHEYLRHDNHARYSGLTIWSPNINIFRDPRWGRGQETYGEDPLLTARLAKAFIHGLQGDDPRYLKTVATVKHYAVHSGPEPDRHSFDAVVDDRDLHETYLRHFEASLTDADAYSVMCAYNRVDGEAACASPRLLQDVLRGAWRFPGFVVSDCGAVEDIYQRHKLVPTAAEAAAMAVKAGTDLECGGADFAYKALPAAVKQGLITEREIDVAVKRLFTARVRLGMFDPPSRVAYAQIPPAVVDSQAHRALALQVARESIVLLENKGNLLPLRKDVKTIAVIGPNADEWRMLLGNYNGTPADPVTPLRGIREAVSKDTRVITATGSDLAEGFPVMRVLKAPVLFTPDGRPGLRVEYFGSRTLEGEPVAAAVDATVDADWRDGAPRPGMNPDDFGVRWTGVLRPSVTGTYKLGLIGTVKYQLFLDDKMVVESVYRTHHGEFPDPRPTYADALTLEAGRSYRLRVEAEESYGDADLQLLWSPPHQALLADAEQAAREADVVVLCVGLTARLEGEELGISIPGFVSGDRTTIDLPKPQQQLLERIVAVGKPTVVVLMSGSAVALNWAQEHAGAVVAAWYPGQAAGTALADVLFGTYNPAGRLPVTFYRSTDDIPPFKDYNMAGRTYRYFAGKPLYAFGYGLSYTTFAYKQVKTDTDRVADDGQVVVRVDMANSGQRAGDEVVQVYAQYLDSKVKRPIRELVGYRRVSLRAGEPRTVEIPLRAQDLRYWDTSANRWTLEPGRVRLQVGASSADLRLETTIAVGR
jgi:beta-glucosidase